MKAITGQFLLLSTSEFSSLPVFIPILLLFLTLMIEKKNPSSWQNPILYLCPGFHFLSPSENTASTVNSFSPVSSLSSSAGSLTSALQRAVVSVLNWASMWSVALATEQYHCFSWERNFRVVGGLSRYMLIFYSLLNTVEPAKPYVSDSSYLLRSFLS